MPTPSASNTSALPQRLDTERLPCLATRTPAPASTSAAAVETLMVPARSPPVPHVSKTSPALMRQRHGVRAHRLCQADDFFRALALHRQPDQQPGQLRRRGLARHHEIHRAGGLLGRQVLVPGQFVQQLGEHSNAGLKPCLHN